MKAPVFASGLFICLICMAGGRSGRRIDTSAVEGKLENLVIGQIQLEAASLSAAVDLVREKSRESDRAETDPELKGVRIGFDRRRGDEPEKLITLKMKKVKLGDLLEELAKQANRSLEVFEDGVVLRRGFGPVELDGLLTRTYRVPPDFLLSYANNDDVVDDPFAPDAGVRGERKSAQEILESHGVTFPDGASARYSPTIAAIIVKNTSENHDLVETLVQYIGVLYPVSVRVRTEVYEVTSQLAQRIARRAETGPGGNFGTKEAEHAVARGEAKLLASPSLVTRSGLRAKIQSGWECQYVKGFKLEDGEQRVELGSKLVGTSLEVDPVMGADGETIELNLAVSVSRGEPTFRRVTILSPVTGEEVEVDAVELDAAEFTTALTMKSGQPTFVGILSNDAESGCALVAFVTASIVTSHYEPPLPE